ncbi:TonB-dependent receptor [Chryseolinea lacunae]|uniref:TonB-dependent receptor n=1 Tax=Chryseolinea lacunae TaxID=2801331 RepID=A0ABS1KWL0_9BACT|nr:TonB-dependent receptor [Chryseolinea lacunae]MBL0742701.1 TonB-dependent receptor [Chryseolinea lacunae]
MHALKIYVLVLIGTLAAHFAWGQTASVGGTVLEHAAQQPLEFSTVSLYRSDSTLATGALTDSKGSFVLKDVKVGTYYLKVQFLGYEEKHVSGITLTKGQHVDAGVIVLQANRALLDEIEVRAEKMGAYHQIDKQVYTASQFQASQGGNAVDVLRNLPSLTVNSEGDVAMRGTTGFIVMLDGKAMQADPLVVLNQLPANTLESVEIITTPSSKYDPDGKAGIINITTKKGATDGYYILANAQGGLPSVQDYGNEKRPIRFGGDITANYKKQKWNASLSANYKRDDIAGYRDGTAKSYVDNVYTDFPSVGERSYHSYSYGVKGVVSYQADKNNLVEAGFYAGKKSQFRKANILYQQKRVDETTGAPIDALDYFNENLRERKGDFVVTNLDYTHTFPKGATLAVSGLYEKTILGGPTHNRDVNPEQHAHVYNEADMQENNPLNGARLKADYALPVGKKGKFEAGYQYRYLLHKGDFVYSQRDLQNDTWFVRDDLSSTIRLTRNIHSLYSQFSNEVGKLSYTAGLRLEEVNRVLTDKSVADPYVFKRLNLFPSANVLYTLNRGYKLKAGYSRRIAHTTSNMMNPFPARRHSETIEIGDPNLLPEYIDVVELGGVKDFNKGSVFANVYYRNTQHVINRVNTLYNDTILLRTYTNAGNAHAFGLEAGADLKLTAWWSLFAGGNVYTYNIQGTVFNADVNTSSVNYSINANTTFRLSPTLTLQWTLNYTSETVTAQGVDSRFVIPTATVKKTILKGQGSLSLQWQNIDLGVFGSNAQRITTRGADFYSSTDYTQEVDVFRINFGFQLNKIGKKLKFTESEFGEKEF